jgi:cytochrome P450
VAEEPQQSEWEPNEAWAPVARAEATDAATAYAEARARCPVVRVEAVFGGFWAVLGHDELVEAALATETFSNVVPLFATRRPPLECDPPEHQFYRRMLNGCFARDKMKLLEPGIRRFAVEMLEPLLATGSADLAVEFTYPFPTRVLCLLLSLPDEDWRLIKEWTEAALHLGGQSAPGSSERIAAEERIRPYMLELIAARRERPGDDLVSALVGGDHELPSLDDETILGIVMMLFSAGHGTTTSAIGNLVLRLARDPVLQERLRRDPALLPAAIEESVRIDAPQQARPRVATQDADLAGRQIAKGDWVWLVFGAANLDERAFVRPAEFDLERSPNRHVGFGRGIHLCIGAPLARLEIRVFLEELLARTTGFELAGPVARLAAWPRLGVSSLPLRFATT